MFTFLTKYDSYALVELLVVTSDLMSPQRVWKNAYGYLLVYIAYYWIYMRTSVKLKESEKDQICIAGMLLTSPGLFELENSQGKEFSVTGLMSVVP
jgi:hypothetical protein